MRHRAGAAEHELAADFAGLGEDLGARFLLEDDLRLAVAVAQIDKQHRAVVAIGIDPAAKGHRLADMGGSQLPASVSP